MKIVLKREFDRMPLEAARTRLELSQRDLAEQTKMRCDHLSRILAGKRPPTEPQLRALCAALGVPMDVCIL